jgi:hypothetical protein
MQSFFYFLSFPSFFWSPSPFSNGSRRILFGRFPIHKGYISRTKVDEDRWAGVSKSFSVGVVFTFFIGCFKSLDVSHGGMIINQLLDRILFLLSPFLSSCREHRMPNSSRFAERVIWIRVLKCPLKIRRHHCPSLTNYPSSSTPTVRLAILRPPPDLILTPHNLFRQRRSNTHQNE